MNGVLQPAAATTFDAAASIVSLIVYLGVAIAVRARASGDVRARVFLVVALTSAIPYALSPLQWWKGNGVYTPPVIALAAGAFTLGGVALFHFTQVFPRRRPWIAAHGMWLVAAYALLPLPVMTLAALLAALIATASAANAVPGAVSTGAVGLLLALLPAVFIVALVLPFAGVMSLARSWQEAARAGRTRDRDATRRMLVSQLGGGVLAILVLPMLHLVGVRGPWSVAIAALTYAFALLLPLAFLAAMTNNAAPSASA